MKFKHLSKKLFFIPLLFFVLGIININLSLLGLICFILPFIFLAKYRKKIWCQYYCPRSGMLQVLLTKFSLKLKPPKWLTSKNIKEFFVYYFFVSLFIISYSTWVVYQGKVLPLTHLRFFLIFKIPLQLPQLIDFSLHPAILHLSYRVYSMIVTTTIIGLTLGLLYMPRFWCSICPINSLSTLKSKK